MDLLARYQDVRGRTVDLAAPLSPEDQTVQSMPDVSPTKWHLAHTTWFFETFVLAPTAAGYRLYDPEYDYLFNSYYESVGERFPRARRGLVTRPGVKDVGRYRTHVDEAMAQLLDADVPGGVGGLVELGLHHEQQHQELVLMDICHVLHQSPLRPTYAPAATTTGEPAAAASTAWHDLDGGVVDLGHAGPGFAFDNEGPRHQVLLEPYRVADRVVTCGDWLEFMADDGYRRHDLWLSDGWAAVHAQGWQAPLYWEQVDGTWHEFTLHGPRPVDPAAPVAHVSHYEADAYAHWAGARLPTEFEWEHAVVSLCGERTVEPAPGQLATAPVLGSGPLPDRFGQVWQWTASAYLPYPRFRPAAGAVGEYNGKFMSGQMVLRGSSCLTPTGHARTTYRNFFPPAARWIGAGLRLAADL
ncbi:MAG: ergothioneine biosynthesis protein EgtB [Actinomycetes bacterium]